MTEHRTLTVAEAIAEIEDTLAQLPDWSTKRAALIGAKDVHFLVLTSSASVTLPDLPAGVTRLPSASESLPIATFGDMDRPVGPGQLDGGTGPL